jgi:predicted NACHT family NTPase
MAVTRLHGTTGAAKVPIFNWQRFWVPRTGSIDLSDGGFLVDPTSPLRSGSGAKQLAELGNYRALVLLGEPGIGKSTTILEDSIRLAGKPNTRTLSVHADLRAYSTEILLHKRVFENAEFTAWATGDSHLVLHLDSLDEALLRIDTIANLLADELPRYPTGRLSIRIACRTAVWPSATLEPALRGIWGDSAVEVLELAPLRRRDVATAAETAGIDVDRFFRELYSANAVPFAIKPLTLNLLLALFKKDGRLPRSAAEIYFRGCLKLCEEQSSSRRDSRKLGAHTPAQRLRIASRVAATTMFANRYAVWTGTEGDGVPDEDVSLSALAGEVERGDFPSFEMTEDSLRETLDTGLFTSRGEDRMGWAHQSYAEYLAAHYLQAKEVSAANILKVLLHPAGGLVPQLSVVTAWISSINRDVRRELMRTEPMVLLQGDLTNWETGDLKDLSQSLMSALDESRAHDLSIGISQFYGRLKHPDLSSQLRPYITDASKTVVSRRTAILIAESCGLKELRPELLKLALDRTADSYLRGRAVDALSTCGDDTIIADLFPLAKGQLGPDPHDEIKGYALKILWPEHISARELFALLTPPNDGFVGAYVMFLTTILPGTLKLEDLPIALVWATSLPKETGRTADYHTRSLADSILIRAWESLERPEIADPLLDYIFARLRAHHELFGGTSLRELERFRADFESDGLRRRTFLLAAAHRPLTRTDAYHLMRTQLLRQDDLKWLLQVSPGGPSGQPDLNGDALCSMVGMIANFDSTDQFAAIYRAALHWPALWQSFRGVFEGVPLDSEDARQARSVLAMTKTYEEKKPPPLTPPPAERVVNLLNLFDAGDWNAWWQLNRELTLTPTSRFYDDFFLAISGMPGWLEAEPTTRQRILHAANSYLFVAESSAAAWIGTNSVRFVDLSGLRALLLLREVDEPTYHAIPIEVWRKWAPAMAAIPKVNGSKEVVFLNEIVVDALRKAPDEFVGAVREIVRRERAKTPNAGASDQQAAGTSFFILRQLDGCWDSDVLKRGLFAELQDATNSEDQFTTILEALLEAEFAPARAFAVERLTDATAPHALSIATNLAAHCSADAWAPLWKVVLGNQEFGREFFLRIAQRYRFQESFLSNLSEQQLAELYVHLEDTFPRAADPQHATGEVHSVGPRESLSHLRDSVPQLIASRGTVAGVSAMQWIVAKLPTEQWLSFRLLEAQRMMRMKTWSPLAPRELFRLFASTDRVLVQSVDDLSELLVNTLRKFERELHGEQNPIRGLWDKQAGVPPTFRPVDEDAFSDVVRLFLKRELIERGIVANREVEVARVPGAPIGRRTDIRIDALRHTIGGTRDVITAVIESKGCWNATLFRSLKDQLYGDYMVTLRAPVGIYLVGWFDKPKWDSKDQRRRQAPDLTIEELQVRLEQEAIGIPKGYVVRPVVVDCHAP